MQYRQFDCGDLMVAEAIRMTHNLVNKANAKVAVGLLAMRYHDLVHGAA